MWLIDSVQSCIALKYVARCCYFKWSIDILSSKYFLDKLNYTSSDLLLFCRSPDFAKEEVLYLVTKTRLIVMSLWATSLCTACASPWLASSFCSSLSWFVSVAAKTHVQLFKMGKCFIGFIWNTCVEECWDVLPSVCCTDGEFVNFSGSGSLNFWSWLGLQWELSSSLTEPFMLVLTCSVELL